MSTVVVFEIARYDVGADKEVLLHRAQVLRTDGSYRFRRGDGREPVVADAKSSIRDEPELNEVRANQITRITASSELVDDLPFFPVSPGSRDDFDEDSWSDNLRAEHVDQEWTNQTGLYRVLYVNGDRWCPWPTADGDRLLPEDWPTIRLESEWAELSFIETGSMLSGVDKTVLGLVSSGVAASATEPDPGLDYDEQEVRVWRGEGSAEDDARIFLDWLLDNPLERFWDLSMGNMLAKLFVEAALNGRNCRPVWGEQLAAGEVYEPAIAGTPSAQWCLDLTLSSEVIESALNQMAERSPELCDAVAAVRKPESEAGRARRELLDTLGY